MRKLELSTPFGLLAIAVATLSAPGFEACASDDEAYPFYGPDAEYFGLVPGMTFWSVQAVPSAPPTNLHLIVTPKGARTARPGQAPTAPHPRTARSTARRARP
jgi:hypothetical protein